MQFGIAIPTDSDSWKITARADELGFASAWFYDTQMLSADCFVAMGAAAVKTSRIRLGTGVLVPSNRIAAVAANAFASLNKLAPGRIDFGIGTGFTARRAMGLGAVSMKEMEEYIRVVMALLRRETVETEIEGQRKKIRFLNPELGLINTSDPVGLHISAYGPRGMNLTARLGAGWVAFVGDDASTAGWLRDMQATWEKSGRSRSDLIATGFALGCVLADGEPYDSPRAIAQAGPRAADAAIAGLPNTSPIPASAADAVANYIELARNFEPADAPYLENHRGHLMFVKDTEREFVTADLIRTMTFTGTEAQLTERIATMRDAGYTEFTIQIVPGQEHAIEDWARIMRRLR